MSLNYVLVATVVVCIAALPVFNQECVLKVGAWEAFPEESLREGGSIFRRKATLKDFEATALNLESKRLFKGVYLLGNYYFEKIPQGKYDITIRKPGFKTIVQTFGFSCANNADEFDFVDIRLSRGQSTQVERRTIQNSIPPRDPNKYTVRGDPRYSSSASGYSDGPASAAVPRIISGGVLNGKAMSLPKPDYPNGARAVRASGAVTVEVVFDENGDVIDAVARSGHPLLRNSARLAALSAKFQPVSLDGEPVRVRGVVTYNFPAPN